jgi:hypothetical protein
MSALAPAEVIAQQHFRLTYEGFDAVVRSGRVPAGGMSPQPLARVDGL